MSVTPKPEPSTTQRLESTASNKIFVSKLEPCHTSEDIKNFFSGFGDLREVVVDGHGAIVTFKDTKVVKELEALGEIMFESTKLFIARVIEEHQKAPVTFDPSCHQVVSTSQQVSYHHTDPMLNYYPNQHSAWYQTSVYPPPSYLQEQLVSVHAQGQLVPAPIINVSLSSPSVLPSNYDINATVNAVEQSVFSFDTTAHRQQQQQVPELTGSYTHSSGTGCYVCSTPGLTVAGVNSLQAKAYSTGSSHGHQLQPLTPVTPTIHTGYILPPCTPTPTYLPPMTPTYYLPPSPAPPVYNSYNFTCPPPAPVTSFPPGQSYSSLKKAPGANPQEEKHNMAYFTSPFKRFSKFRGTPSVGGFPLKSAGDLQGFKRRDSGDSNNCWYQEGERWGHKSGGKGDVPDIVKDC